MIATNQKQALTIGATYYFTGKPCKWGHITERYAPNATCIECMKIRRAGLDPAKKSAQDKRYRAKYPEKISARKAEYRKQHRERDRQRMQEWLIDPANRAKHRANCKKSNHKLLGLPTPTRECPDICECCGKPPTFNSLHLDHCHKTNIFRGWLCMKCNTAIAKLGDNEEGLINALVYLARVAKS